MHQRWFKIRGATHTKDKEIIFCCRWYGEPFNVEPNFDSKTRKKMWLNCESYFDKWLLTSYSDASKVGVPRGEIVGIDIMESKREPKVEINVE